MGRLHPGAEELPVGETAPARKSLRFTALHRYAAAVSATVLGLLLRWALLPVLGLKVPYITLWWPIAFAAWYCGLVPSLVALAVATLGVILFFMTPGYSLAISQHADQISVLTFVVGSLILIGMGEANRRRRGALAASNASLGKLNAELEDRVLERTQELAGTTEQVRALTARLLRLQDEERRRLARELHDDLGQLLAAVNIDVEAIRRESDKLSPAAVRSLNQSAEGLQQLMREVRAFSYLLHPPLLDEVGLALALRWYLEGFAQRTNTKILSDIADVGRLPADHEMALFRVTQESMTNVHRHAQCTECRVQLALSDTQVTLQISDNGKGLSAGTPANIEVGVGLRGMRERIEQLSGRFEISSTANGTLVKASLPIPACVQRPQNT